MVKAFQALNTTERHPIPQTELIKVAWALAYAPKRPEGYQPNSRGLGTREESSEWPTNSEWPTSFCETSSAVLQTLEFLTVQIFGRASNMLNSCLNST